MYRVNHISMTTNELSLIKFAVLDALEYKQSPGHYKISEKQDMNNLHINI